MSATTIVINDVEPRRQYTATGGQTVFDFPIPFFDDGDLEVYLTPVGQTPDDAADLLTITTEYTVAGANTQDGGEITLVTPATAGDVITIERVVDIDRLADYQVAGDLLAETLNKEQDTEIMISQQLRQSIDRCLQLPSTTQSTGADLTLPEPDANYILGWNGDGDAIVNYQEIGTYRGTDTNLTTSNYLTRDLIKCTSAGQLDNVYIALVDTTAGVSLTDTAKFALIVDAVSAATSAANAATSESNAATSESNAATSASNAATSETNAATSESNAATSESNAATSETNAAASAANLPNASTAGADKYIKSNATGDAWVYKTPAEVATDLGISGAVKNVIINGSFDIAQRGTSFVGVSDGDYTLDRILSIRSNDGVVDHNQASDSPTADEAGVYTTKCFHLDVTTADATIASGQYETVFCRLEGLNVARFGFGQAGTRNITLSFWHKHTKTGTYCVAVRNNAADRGYVAEYNQSVSDTWEKAEITIPVDTTGTWLYTTGTGLVLIFSIAAGSTFHTTANTWAAAGSFATSNQVNGMDSASNNFKLAQIQLEEGSAASTFEQRPIGEEEALCQRYFIRMDVSDSARVFCDMSAYGTDNCYGVLHFPTQMRATPAASVSSDSDFQVQIASASVAPTTVQAANGTKFAMRMRVLKNTAFTNGDSGWLSSVNANAYIDFDSEL